MKKYSLIVAIILSNLYTVFGQEVNAVAVTSTTCEAMCKANTSKKALLLQSIGNNFKKNAIASTNEMVWVAAGEFSMGTNDYPDAKPIHKVSVKGYWIDEHEVTNAQFAAFVTATNYVTIAERPLDPADYPGVPLDKLVPGSAVFVPPTGQVPLDNIQQWWQYVPGASWQHPSGPESSIAGLENNPVVQVSYLDAKAYADWAGKRLLTEAEWEFAARAGRPHTKYYWGTDLKPNGKWLANIFQGTFPNNNTAEDGFANAAPVKSFPKNPLGIYDLEGNVWEWCSDLYSNDYYKNSTAANPQGPSMTNDPEEPGIEKHVQRGGSYLCSDQYCIRYVAGSRGKGETTSACNHLGFRCVKDAE
ncbi:MAG: formylglycine-generating enzyme family protein [Bacteroidota bacterium]